MTAVPRLALQRKEAAVALGVSPDTFDRHVRPSLPVVYLGSTRLWRVADLDAFLQRQGNELPSSPSAKSAPATLETSGGMAQGE